MKMNSLSCCFNDINSLDCSNCFNIYLHFIKTRCTQGIGCYLEWKVYSFH